MRTRWIAGLVALAACADPVPMPDELLHPRVLAVRTDPAALAPEEVATVEVLLGGAGGATRADAASMSVALAPEVAAWLSPTLVERSADGWRVRAPDAATVEVARQALGLSTAEPLALPLVLEVEHEGAVFAAQKWIRIGATAANPEVTALTVDGQAVSAMALTAGATSTLSVAHSAGDEAVVRWSSSVGELESYQAATTVLTADEAGVGEVAVVVRDASGGTTWQVLPVRVE